MARDATQIQRSFNGGEQSELLGARADLDRWKTSLSVCENWTPLLQGGVTRRSGFLDVAGAMDNSRLIEFRFGKADGYAVEAGFVSGAGKLRFFRDFGQVVTGPSTPYQIDHPWGTDDVPKLRRAQRADVLYIATGTGAVPIQTLTRLSNTNWSLAAPAFKNGPFLDENGDTAKRLYTIHTGDLLEGTTFQIKAFGWSGTGPFTGAHVGALFRIAANDQRMYPKWEADKDMDVGGHPDLCVYWGDNLYAYVSNIQSHTGIEPPVHLTGQQDDGFEHYVWRYLHAGWGVVKITGYVDDKTVNVTAMTAVPADLRGQIDGGGALVPQSGDKNEGGIWRWREGAWSQFQGYPQRIGFHGKRFWAMGTPSNPTRGWASVIDDYTNFRQGADDTDAIAFTFDAGSGEVNMPEWMVSGSRLAIGTSGEEFVISSADSTTGITPDSIDIAAATDEGSGDVEAIKVGNPVFVSKDGRRIHMLSYDIQTEQFTSPDLTIEADDVTGPGVVELAWLRDPYRLLVARRSDGVLAVCALRQDQGVKAWHRYTSAKGAVQSICAAASPSGVRQDLWAVTQRALTAGKVRRVECLAPFFERGSRDVRDAVFVDAAFQYSGEAHTTISGIPAHMNGETVAVLADGKVVRDAVVASGAITLPFAASQVTLGLRLTATLTTLRTDRDALAGKLTGGKMRVFAVVADVLRAAGLTARAATWAESLLRPSGDDGLDAPVALASGATREIPVAGDWDDDGQVTITAASPLPATIRALTPKMRAS